MRGATGTYDSLTPLEITTLHPWYQDFERTSITYKTKDTPADGGTVTCTFNRQWVTIYSDLILQDWVELKGQFGFKVYNDQNVDTPFPKGYVKDFRLVVIDASVTLSSFVTAAILLTGLNTI